MYHQDLIYRILEIQIDYQIKLFIAMEVPERSSAASPSISLPN